MIALPPGVIPVRDLSTREVLYGARSTSYRYEMLTHDPVTGVDSLLGFLDGVEQDGFLRWSAAARVKKSGAITVRDLAAAEQGRLRLADVDLMVTRVRPVLVIEGLPEIPLGVYLLSASKESWSGTGRKFPIDLHDKSSALDQDAIEASFTAAADVPALSVVRQVVESAGEIVAIDESDARTLTAPLVWEAGTSKLTIVNDLLDALGYQALWVDGVGNFRLTRVTRPAERSTRYTMLNDAGGQALMRELADGAESIYLPEWVRDRDLFAVPNKVIAVQAGAGFDEPLSGVATNENPASPFSYQSRGRWIPRVELGVEVPDYSADPDPDALTVAFLEEKARQWLIASSSVQASVSVKCLPIPVELLDAVRFAHAPAGIDARHTVRSLELDLRFDGLMSLELQEVIDL